MQVWRAPHKLLVYGYLNIWDINLSFPPGFLGWVTAVVLTLLGGGYFLASHPLCPYACVEEVTPPPHPTLGGWGFMLGFSYSPPTFSSSLGGMDFCAL